MSVSFGCNCQERKKPVNQRNWVVIKRNYSCSAFNGYHCKHSDYSTVYCRSCHAVGRTKAKYVYVLPDGTF